MRLSRPAECVSDLVLDEWSSDELDAVTRERTENHVAACARCRARHDALERQRADFATSAPTFEAHARRFVAHRVAPSRIVSRSSRGRARTWLVAAAAAAAIAAATLLAIEPSERTRLKGGPTISYVVKRGERVEPGDASTVVRPGDLLRFTYTSDQDRYFALFNRDAKSASVYFPAGEQATRVTAGNNVALDFSVQLDDAPGPEEVHALFCAERFELAPLRAALNDTGRLPIPGGCYHQALTLQKDARR